PLEELLGGLGDRAHELEGHHRGDEIASGLTTVVRSRQVHRRHDHRERDHPEPPRHSTLSQGWPPVAARRRSTRLVPGRVARMKVSPRRRRPNRYKMAATAGGKT